MSNDKALSDSHLKNKHEKLCHIVKIDNFDGYGFNLHSEKTKSGQYIGRVDENSPAQLAGLNEGDRIICVNGVNIGNETHTQVVERIKAIQHEVQLLVIDQKIILNNDNNIDEQNIMMETNLTTNQSNILINNKNDIDLNNKSIDNNFIKIDQQTILTKNFTNKENSSKLIDRNLKIDNNCNNDENNIDDNLINNTINNKTIKSNQTLVDSVDGNDKMENLENNIKINLKMTAGELRAKLLSKKKYDPKNDSVDLIKKFNIIEEL